MINVIRERLGAANALIEEDGVNLGKGYRIGHSFFVPADKIEDEVRWFREIIDNEIRPLIEEYWLDNEKKIAEFTQSLIG